MANTYYKNVFYSYFGKGSVLIVDLILVKSYLQYLGVESYGLISIYGVLIVLLSALDFGLLPTTTRELAAYRAGVYTKESIIGFIYKIELNFILIGLVVPIVMYYFSDLINEKWLNYNLVDHSNISKIFLAMGLSLYGRLLESIYRAMLNGLQEIVKINIINIISSLTKYAFIIICLKFSENKIQNVFVAQFILSILISYVYRLITYVEINKQFNNKNNININFKALNSYRFGMAIIAIESIFLGQLDKLILSGTLGLENFGYYSLAATASSIIFIVIHPVVATFGAKAMELRAKKEYRRLIDYYHQSTKIVTIIIGSVTGVLIFYTEEVLLIWLSNKAVVEIISNYVRLMLLGNMLNGFCWLPFQLQVSYGWIRYGIISNAIALIVIIPALLFVTSKYGIYGAIFIWIILNIFYITVGISIMHKKLLKKEKMKWYINDILIPLIIQIIITVTFFIIIDIKSLNIIFKIAYFMALFLMNIFIPFYLMKLKIANE